MVRYIVTSKYAGPTNNAGPRVLVYSGARKRPIAVAWNHALGIDENHQRAAWEAVRKIEGGKAPGIALLDCTTTCLPDACNHSHMHVLRFEESAIDPDAQCSEHGCATWRCVESHSVGGAQ